MEIRRPIDDFVNAGTYRPSGRFHSTQQLVQVALASLYICMYICTLSVPQVSEAPQVA